MNRDMTGWKYYAFICSGESRKQVNSAETGVLCSANTSHTLPGALINGGGVVEADRIRGVRGVYDAAELLLSVIIFLPHQHV